MRKGLILSFVALLWVAATSAQDFDSYFTDKTLRIDYTFSGNSSEQHVSLRELSMADGWWGRRVNLDNVPLKGNGDLTLYSADGQNVIYKTSFSSLFQEWITTPEAQTISKSFEFTILVPMPIEDVIAEIVLRDNTGKESVLRHTISPNDKLIRDRSRQQRLPHKYIHQGGDSKECIDVVILAEGYTVDEMDTYFKDAHIATEEILSYEPFKTHADKFNFIVIASPSEDSNVTVPQENAWRTTAVGLKLLYHKIKSNQ